MAAPSLACRYVQKGPAKCDPRFLMAGKTSLEKWKRYFFGASNTGLMVQKSGVHQLRLVVNILGLCLSTIFLGADDTVDGKAPAPVEVGIQFIPLFTGFFTSQVVVEDFCPSKTMKGEKETIRG